MEIQKSKLKKALEIVKPGLANKEIMEQTSSFAFIGDRVVTYNDEISLSHPVEGMEIQGAIKAEELYKFLTKVKTEEIELEEKDNQIVLKNGRANVGFIVAKEINLPLDEEVAVKGDWKKLPKEFTKALTFTADVCSKDQSDPKLVCVHVNEEGFVEGSDKYRIAQYKMKVKMPVPTTLLPATSAKEIIKMNPTKIASGKGWVHFKNEEDTILSCRIFNEAYVNTAPILKTPKNGIEVTFPEELPEILEKARIFAERKSIIDENVDITLKKKTIVVESKSETGWFKESAPIDYKGDSITFSTTPYLLKDILKDTQSCAIFKDRLKFESDNWIYITALRKSNIE